MFEGDGQEKTSVGNHGYFRAFFEAFFASIFGAFFGAFFSPFFRPFFSLFFTPIFRAKIVVRGIFGVYYTKQAKCLILFRKQGENGCVESTQTRLVSFCVYEYV